MRKVLFIMALLGIAISSGAEDGVTFQIEELSKPAELLPTENFQSVYNMILGEERSIDISNSAEQSDYDNILFNSIGDTDLAITRSNSFFNGMREAYANHRPVVFSPDIIWTLISQGFANHINNNSNKYKDLLIKSDEEKTIVANIGADLANTDWPEVINTLSSSSADNMKSKLGQLLVCDFSTTTQVEKAASQIIMLKAVESYFEFEVRYLICGVPQVTLLGTPDDWRKVKDKTLQLEQYDLKWWTDRLIPILDEFIAASEGNANVDFWKDMVKIKKAEFCGDPEIVNGWFITFYPYNESGTRQSFKQISNFDELPSEIVKLRLDYKISDGIGTADAEDLEVWAGFFGWEQNASDYSIKPHIGWLIKQSTQSDLDLEALKRQNKPDSYGIQLKVDKVPEVLKEFDHIYRLTLTFTETSELPEWLRDIQIDYLELNGKVSAGDRVKAALWFDNVKIR